MNKGSDRHERDCVYAALFEGREPKNKDTMVLFEQYRILVETSQSLVSRRQGVNTFFLSVNSITLTVAALLLRDGSPDRFEALALTGLGFAGAVLCWSWHRLIQSYGQLNTGKYAVIHALERRLPARVFTAEWAFLTREYVPFTGTWSWPPRVFGVLQVLLLVFGLCTLSSQQPASGVGFTSFEDVDAARALRGNVGEEVHAEFVAGEDAAGHSFQRHLVGSFPGL